MPRIARVLETAALDIIGLNEVNRDSVDKSQDKSLASELGPDWTAIFGKTINKPLWEYGNAILTRLPIISSESWALTDFPGQELRGMVRVTVQKDDSAFHVFCTHLGLNSEMRSRHVVEILSIMSRFTNAPRILVGDFNEGRGSAAVEAVAGKLTDLWAAYGIGPAKTFSSIAPFRRIDYIWTDKELVATSCYVARHPPVFTASDHFPVFARLVRSADMQHGARNITARINGHDLLCGRIAMPLESGAIMYNSLVMNPATGPADDTTCENLTLKVLTTIYQQSLSKILVGKSPPEWTQLQRSTGKAPFGGVEQVGVRKLWRQHSEQLFSYQHKIDLSPSSSGCEVSARIKTLITGGGSWRFGLLQSSTDPAPGVNFNIEISHDARNRPRLRLLAGEREMASIVLAERDVDPYDWNVYTLELQTEPHDQFTKPVMIAVAINGRREISIPILPGSPVSGKKSTTSIVLATKGRSDASCDIFMEGLTMRQWVEIKADSMRPVKHEPARELEVANLANGQQTTIPSTIATFDTADTFDAVTFGVNVKLAADNNAQLQMGLAFIQNPQKETADAICLLQINGTEGVINLKLTHGNTTLAEQLVSPSELDLNRWNHYELSIRRLPPYAPIIKDGLISSWKGFF